MKKIYFTITGMNHYSGSQCLKKGMTVHLEKDPDNKYDREAIRVTMEGLGKIGYVANSTNTVKGESYSAGRLYDKIGDTAKGKVKYIFDNSAVCVLKNESPKGRRPIVNTKNPVHRLCVIEGLSPRK